MKTHAQNGGETPTPLLQSWPLDCKARSLALEGTVHNSVLAVLWQSAEESSSLLGPLTPSGPQPPDLTLSFPDEIAQIGTKALWKCFLLFPDSWSCRLLN